MNSRTVTEFIALASSLIVCLSSPHDSAVVDACRATLEKAISGNLEIADLLESSQNILPNEIQTDDVEQKQKVGETLQAISPFSTALEKMVKLKMNSDFAKARKQTNPLHLPEIVKYLEVYYFPLAPFWTGILLGKLHRFIHPLHFSFFFLFPIMDILLFTWRGSS